MDKKTYWIIGIIIVAIVAFFFINSSMTGNVVKNNEIKSTCSDECNYNENFCLNGNVYSCYDIDGDGCKEKEIADYCDTEELCSGGTCKLKPIQLNVFGSYDSCYVKTESRGSSGISIVQTDAVEGLDYYDKRGGIEVGFEVLEGGSMRDRIFEIETKVLDSAGRTTYKNEGSFSGERLYGTSECDNCYSIPNWISLPYEENGKVWIKITTEEGNSFETEIYIEQEDCLTEKITKVFLDLMECSESNQRIGEDCECFEGSSNRCLSHTTTEGGYYPNSNGYITLIPGDKIYKDKIIKKLNIRNFDFKFETVENQLSGFVCEGDELSATKQRELYLLGQYYIEKPDYADYQYSIFCSEKDR